MAEPCKYCGFTVVAATWPILCCLEAVNEYKKLQEEALYGEGDEDVE
jgi:hypothetical protein